MAITFHQGLAPITKAIIDSVYPKGFRVTIARQVDKSTVAVYCTNPDFRTVGCTVPIKDLKEALRAIEE